MKVIKYIFFLLVFAAFILALIIFFSERESRKQPRPGCWELWQKVSAYRDCTQETSKEMDHTAEQGHEFNDWCTEQREKFSKYGISAQLTSNLLSIRGDKSVYTREQVQEFCAAIPEDVYARLPE